MRHNTVNVQNLLTLPAKKGGYKHSIDPFLIADFVSGQKSARTAADFCAGNGIIGALLARKYSSLHLMGFEFQWSLASEAGKIVRTNGLEKRVSMVCGDLNTAGKMVSSGVFDFVVGNPPYRRIDDGRINPDPEKAIARHELNITINSFLNTSYHVLKDRGRVFVIYHPYRLSELFEKLKGNRLSPLRVRFVHSFAGKESSMVMVEAVKNGRNDLKVDAPLIIYDQEGFYSQEVVEIYKNFGCAMSDDQVQ